MEEILVRRVSLNLMKGAVSSAGICGRVRRSEIVSERDGLVAGPTLKCLPRTQEQHSSLRGAGNRWS